MILITGGAGYIGSHVNKVFAKNNYKTLVYDNLSRGFRSLVKWGEFIEGDLANAELLSETFNKNKNIEAVIHLAAFAYVGESANDPIMYFKNNISNTINLIEQVVAHKIPFLIFSSTCSLYGNPDQLPISEATPVAPINPYALSKSICEQLIHEASKKHGFKYCFLRYFNASGADPEAEIGELHYPETHLIPLVIEAAFNQGPLRVFGNDYNTPDGTCIRDYTHVSDLARAHLDALNYLQNNDSNIFNLGSNKGFSILEVINTVEKLINRKVNFEFAPRRPGDPDCLYSTNTKAIEVLGWKPHYSELEKIITDAINWYKKIKFY